MGKKRKVKSEKVKAESEKFKAKSGELKVKSEKKAESEEVNTSTQAETSDDAFDFGGLPERNLKKNLGCG